MPFEKLNGIAPQNKTDPKLPTASVGRRVLNTLQETADATGSPTGFGHPGRRPCITARLRASDLVSMGTEGDAMRLLVDGSLIISIFVK